jgi:hypothetical protein
MTIKTPTVLKSPTLFLFILAINMLNFRRWYCICRYAPFVLEPLQVTLILNHVKEPSIGFFTFISKVSLTDLYDLHIYSTATSADMQVAVSGSDEDKMRKVEPMLNGPEYDGFTDTLRFRGLVETSDLPSLNAPTGSDR